MVFIIVFLFFYKFYFCFQVSLGGLLFSPFLVTILYHFSKMDRYQNNDSLFFRAKIKEFHQDAKKQKNRPTERAVSELSERCIKDD